MTRFTFLPMLLGVFAGVSAAQPFLTCQPTVNPLVVRGEGLTERMGDIVLQCGGGIPNATITGNLSVFLSVSITNRVDPSGFTDLSLTADNGSGPMPVGARAGYLTPAILSFSGVSFTLSPTGGTVLRLSNLRGAANQAGVDSARQVTASLSFTGGSLVTVNNNIFPVGTVLRSLFSSSTSQLICSQYGSPAITSASYSGAIGSQASYSTVRVTEGFGTAFGPHSDFNFVTGDFGTRIIVRYSGVVPGIRIYVPDAVVGTDGLQPTSAGDYGLPPSGGTYTPGSRSLLLIRVGGSVTRTPASTTSFDSISEVAIGADGVGQAVYEVFDANPFAIESATIPSFVAVQPNAVNSLTQIGQDVFLGASSTTVETTAGAVIPRFVPLAAPNDCGIVGDCAAGYFPHMSIDNRSFDVSMTSNDGFKTYYFTISKSGAGHYLWNASIRYTGGAAGGYQWLKISPTSGLDRETVKVDFVPGNLPPGVYDAIITVDAGAIAGTLQIPVTLRLSYQAPLPVITSAVNPANMKTKSLVPGSAVALMGDRLTGGKVAVTFDGVPATVLNTVSKSRLDVQVPALDGKQSAIVVVTVDGLSSTPGLKVPLGVSAPVIFANTIRNSDSSNNGTDNAAVTGTEIQVLVSGLPRYGCVHGANP